MKKLIFWIIMVVLCVSLIGAYSLTGCKTASVSDEKETEKESIKEQAEVAEVAEVVSEKKWKIAMICHQPHTDFFIPVRVGMEDFVKYVWGEERVEVTWTGPLPGEFSVEKQVEIIDSSIGIYDGIIASAPDPVAYNEVIAKAKAKGLPVITFNTDAPTSMRDAFVGQDRYKRGQRCAYQAIEWVDENLPDRGEGEVNWLVSLVFPGHTAHELTIAGIRSVLYEDPRFKSVLGDDYLVTGTDPTKAYNAYLDAITAHPELDIILDSDAVTGYAAQAVDDAGLRDQIVLFGASLDIHCIEKIKDGSQLYVDDQNQYMQGWLPMALMFAYFELNQPIDANIITDTGFISVGSHNLDRQEAVYDAMMERHSEYTK